MPFQLLRPLQPPSFGSPVVYTTHTFFFSYGKLTVILEDVVIQLLLWVLGDADPATLELSSKEEAIEVELKKRTIENAKLSYWVSSSSKFSVVARRAAFIAFWLCKFVFGSHPHYAIKPLYFCMAIKISAGVSLPLAPMFLGHLYVQLDILRSDESQAGSCHIVTSSVHSTILFEFDFSLAFHWSGLKSIDYFVLECFDEGVGFVWRAYRNLSTGYTCVDSAMGSFVDTVMTTTPLAGFDEIGITYLAAINARWLPSLVYEGIRFVHYLANGVKRQFGLDQDIHDELSYLMESPTSVRPFLRHTAFEF
nr:uncharacterized protein LOC112035649 [Quercus suber]